MRIFIPCEGPSYKTATTLAEHICEDIHKLAPKITTIEVEIDRRGDKLFVDPSQNDEADVLASAYSTRSSKLPTVSTPLDWHEVNETLTPSTFTITTTLNVFKKRGIFFSII